MVDKGKELTLTKEYVETVKYRRWLTFFFDDKNKETFGNAAQAALKAYNLDPVTQYQVACNLGSRNKKKAEIMCQDFLSKMGYSFAQLLEIGIKNVKKGDYNDWRQFMQDMGILDFKEPIPDKQKGPTVNVNNIIGNWVEGTKQDGS